MEKKKSTEHIFNSEVKYYYDRSIQKISNEIKRIYNSGEYMDLGQEEMYIALVMFEKFKIQFYSAISLANRCTQNPLNQFEYIDIASIQTIIRSCYETFLIFKYIYLQPEIIGEKEFVELKDDKNKYFESMKLKVLLYQYDGYNQSYYGLSAVPDEKEKSKKMRDECESKIIKNKLFNSFTNSDQNQILGKWRPSWNRIALKTELSEWNSKNMYNIISQYSHNSYTSLMALNYHYTHLDKFDRNAMLMQLFEFTAIMINDYVKLFNINHSIFNEDEINLLSEFYGYAQINPKDLIK